jgi:hypothetical protein
MGAEHIRTELRGKDFFHRIDMGFINRRLCMTALPALVRNRYATLAKSGSDHMTVLANDHLLVTMLLDICHQAQAPTLLEALTFGKPRHLFRSTERLAPCPEIYEAGAPWFDHPRNGDHSGELMWHGQDFGELLPEDIDQFSAMKNVAASDANEWLTVMQQVSEENVKRAFTSLLNEPSKKDWGGESNDHFSSNVSISGIRRTAAFLFKGPANFREMTLDMCGKRADQIYRLTNSGADISIVQHSHLIGEAVRNTLRALTVFPGYPRKYCLIDGQATYRILKAHALL